MWQEAGVIRQSRRAGKKNLSAPHVCRVCRECRWEGREAPRSRSPGMFPPFAAGKDGQAGTCPLGSWRVRFHPGTALPLAGMPAASACSRGAPTTPPGLAPTLFMEPLS